MARKERKHDTEFIKNIISKIENQELAKSFQKIIGGSKEDGLFIRAVNKNQVEENINIIIENVDLLKEITKKYEVEDSLIRIISNKSNIIKKTCEELNLTYAQLATAIGYKTDTVSKAASTGNISDQLKRAIELYEENVTLRNSIDKYFQLKAFLI